VASDGHLGEHSDRTHVVDFLLAEAGVLNPIFFIGALWAALAFWRKSRRDPWQLYLFSMGAPLFLLYFALSWHSRILANWIAPSVVPLFCLMATYWDARWQRSALFVKPLLCAGLGAGLFAGIVAHDTRLLEKLLRRRVPPPLDLLHRARGWKELAMMVGQARRAQALNGRLPFVICEHYGFTSEITFYLPEAKRAVNGDPVVFFETSPLPVNQFYFWPNYLHRTGQNALFVREIEKPRFRPGWFSRWWNHDQDLYLPAVPSPAPPREVCQHFSSCVDLGVQEVALDAGIIRRIQLFACENLH
jgi:hypothetical protein